MRAVDPARDLHLDGVRGIAIALVLLLHFFRFEPANPAWLALDRLCRSGWLGVDLFFVLSGFLITRILLRSREDPHYFRNFYMRRVLRIFPAYFLYLGVVLLVLPQVLQGWSVPPLGAAWTAAFVLYASNLMSAARGEWAPRVELDHLWSLAIEEQFYLVWPLVVLMTSPHRLKRVCEILIVSAWVLKGALWAAGAWKYAAYILPVTRMDALAAGAWVACHALQGGRPLPMPVRMAVGAALALLLAQFLRQGGLPLHSHAAITLTTSAAALAFAAALHVLALPAGAGWRRPLEAAPLRFLGRYSYGLYLIHRVWDFALTKPLAAMLVPALGTNGAALAAGLLIAVLALGNAIVMYHAIEAPLLRLNRNFRPARSTNPMASPT